MAFNAVLRRPALRSIVLAACSPASTAALPCARGSAPWSSSSSSSSTACIAGPSSRRLQDLSSGVEHDEPSYSGDAGGGTSRARGRNPQRRRFSYRSETKAALAAAAPLDLDYSDQPAPVIPARVSPPKARPRPSIERSAHALSTRLQETLIGPESAAFIPQLVDGVLALMAKYESQLVAFSASKHNRTALQSCQRRVQLMRRSRITKMHTPAQLPRDRHALFSLVLQCAALLTQIDDTRARRAASRLLQRVGSHSGVWREALESDVNITSDQRWKGTSGGQRGTKLQQHGAKGKGKLVQPQIFNDQRDLLLAYSRWKRRRRRRLRLLRLRLDSMYKLDFLERLCRVLLGISLPSQHANSHTAASPSPHSNERNLPLVGSSRWLDTRLMQRCLAYMRIITAQRNPTSRTDSIHAPVDPSVIIVGLLTSVRQRDADLARSLVEELDHIMEDTSAAHAGRPSTGSPPSSNSGPGLGARLGDLLAVQASSVPTSSRKRAKDFNTLCSDVEVGLFRYIDEFARKEMEQLKSPSESPYPHRIAKNLFHRLLESHVRSRRPEPLRTGPHQEDTAHSSKHQVLGLTTRTAAQGMETLARDASIPLEEVFSYFCIDQDGNDITVESRLYHVPLDVSRNAGAYGYAIRGFAMRGTFEASEILFRVFLRRAEVERRTRAKTGVEPRLAFDAFILSFRWTAESLRIQHLSRSNAESALVTAEAAKKALAEVLKYLKVRPSRFEELKQPNDFTSMLQTRAKRWVLPSAKLLTTIVFSLARRWGARRAAFSTWLALDRRWPVVARDSGFLQSLLLTARAIQNEPYRAKSNERVRTLFVGGNPAATARRIFRRWLFAQHPELHPLAKGTPQPPSWLPHDHKEINLQHHRDFTIKAYRHEEDAEPPARPPALLNFSAGLFHAYAHLLVSMIESRIEKRTGFQPREFDCGADISSYTNFRTGGLATAWASRTELVLVLAWMRRLQIQPSQQTLCLIGDQMRRYYHWHRLEWPAGERFDRRASHSATWMRRYEGMGPLNSWLSEWLEDRWPTDFEVQSYAKYRKQAEDSEPATIWDI